jgi:zinc-binding in reverse transcriptase
LQDTSLSYAFSHLFSLVLRTNVRVAQAFQLGISNMQFIQPLSGQSLIEMDNLLGITASVVLLPDQVDLIKWRWSKDKKFTVHSFYLRLNDGGLLSKDFETVWHSKIPFKIQIFMWLVRKNRILTKVNLKNRGWSRNAWCIFYGEEESTDHLFVNCSYIMCIWRWIALYNNFNFQGTKLQDIWSIDASIPFKNI